ncbi:peroxiredoxin family protein [Bacillus salitolerans]|uniref:Peroxiredoxin family protein n=1 Tax=Bacillus salitolerans TaxID=1437434 RepID=A0ABW4LRA5_9BACI
MKRIIAIGILLGLIGYTLYTQLLAKEEEKVIIPANAGHYGEIIKNQGFVGNSSFDFTLSTLEGKKVQLSDYKGKKVILNFWATWCPPCKDEMPHMQEFYDEYSEEVEILAVNLRDRERSDEAIQQFIEANHINFPILLDEKGKVTSAYKVLTIPTSFFIDTQGTIQYHFIGPMSVNDMKRLTKSMN